MEERIVASNGVNIFYYKQPNTHSICISLYIKSGVLYESERIGITHFLEHLHFRKLGGRDQKELYYELESIGAYLGAYTYKEFMRFYLTSSPKYFSTLAKIASALLGELEADAKDFVAEKRLVLSEIREDDQKNDIDFLSNKYIWENTNLQNPILGTISSVNNLTLDMLQAEKERTFTKENIFFYISGNFEDHDIATLKQQVDTYDLKVRPSHENDNNAQIPLNFRRRNAFIKLSQRKPLMHDVKISFDVDFKTVTRHELIYLDSILAEGLCSLLRSEMIEKKGLIYSLSSTIEQYNNIGVYYITFTIYKTKLYEALKSFIYVLKEVKKGITEIDMLATRVFKTDNQMQLLDDADDLNWTFAYENHILRNKFLDISEIADTYMKISKEQLVKTANEIFLPANAMMVSIGNKKGLSEMELHKLLLEL